MILYPRSHQEVHRPFDPNICQATGNPPPRIQLVQPVEKNDNMYKCIADNIVIDNFGGETPHYHMVHFYCKYHRTVLFMYFTFLPYRGHFSCSKVYTHTCYYCYHVIMTSSVNKPHTLILFSVLLIQTHLSPHVFPYKAMVLFAAGIYYKATQFMCLQGRTSLY